MPHAALWVVQLYRKVDNYVKLNVSMPHAALWVVQLMNFSVIWRLVVAFQCRTRLCGWCSRQCSRESCRHVLFQCRTRLCGWCSTIASST